MENTVLSLYYRFEEDSESMFGELEENISDETDYKKLKFVRPYKQLLIWAVLLNR